MKRRFSGELLKELREQKGLTQRSLAALAGMSKTGLVDLETGKASQGPLANTLADLADALELPLGAFFAEQARDAQEVMP
jgi:transcriptional regulator with XRE-family HTH domain